MDFRFKELMVIALPQMDELVLDTCCAASCSSCTSCTRTRAPTPTISPDDDTGDDGFMSELRAQLRERRQAASGLTG